MQSYSGLALAVLAISVLGFPTSEANAEALKIIRLNHRQADSLLPTLQSMYGDKATISAMDSRLIVKGSPERLADIARLASQLDTPTRMLRIAIQGAGAEDSSARQLGLSGQTQLGPHVSVGLQNPPSHSAGTPMVGINTGRHAVGGHIHENRTQQNSSDERFVLVEEGAPARLGGHDNTSVIARVQGDQVSVQVLNIQFDARAPSAASTVSAPLGHWMELGGTSRSALHQGSGILNSHSRDERNDTVLRIRVDLAR